MTAAPLDDSPRGWLDVTYRPAPTERAPRRLMLIRRTSRTAQLEGILARYRWANAGLRERLAELVDQREDLLDALAVIIDEEARVLGHAQPPPLLPP